jgi:hypothetical protein
MMEEKSLAVRDPTQSLTLQKVSQGLFQSGLFPNAKNQYGAFAIVEYGHELGIPPMMSLKNINIISGQLACNAQLMLSLAIAKGVTYEIKEESDKGAKLIFKRVSSTYEASFTEEDAKSAGLLGKDNWKKYPRDMYFWRAVAKGVRRIAPDAVMGLFTAEEITSGDVVDITEITKIDKPLNDDVSEYDDISDKFTKDDKSAHQKPQAEKTTPEAGEDKPGKTQAEKDRQRLEIMIKDAGYDRNALKAWLESVEWLKSKEDGTLSMNDLPDEKVSELITDEKWKQAGALFGKFTKARSAVS